MWPFDQNNQPVYQQYSQAYTTGNYNGFDPNQSWGHVQQFMQNAPFDTQQNLFQQHFAQMPYDQRMAFAQQAPPQYGVNPNDPLSMAAGFMRMRQERPDLLQRIFQHPLLAGGGIVLAGLIAHHMLETHEHNQFIRQEEQQAAFGSPQQFGYQQPGPFGGQPPFDPLLRREERQERELRHEIHREEREERELHRELRRDEREERW